MDNVFDEIIKSNDTREDKILSKFACKSRNGTRKFKEKEDKINIRSPFFRDIDRIIYSQAYSRYVDKTQVFFLFQNDHITHRVLHVQLVSKIARLIGRCLNLNEDLIEAIALGHDLGHVPYGHDGEKYLNDICEEEGYGYFCHNAQSVRFLMEIENKGRGLNLNLQVLDGILSHNGELLQKKYEPNVHKTWDNFMDEYHKCFTIRNYSRKIVPMTLEGCVVRISDIIAYIGRDIEDAIVVRLIKRSDIPGKIVKVLGDNNSDIINSLVLDIVKNSFGKPYIVFSPDIYEALTELLKFNQKKIYNDPRKMTENKKIENMFRYLFHTYLKQLEENDQKSKICYEYLNDMSEEYRENEKCRIVLDYISGMTDNYFNNEFKDFVLPKKYGVYIK